MRRGAALIEQVLALSLLAILLVVVATLMVKSRQSGQYNRRALELTSIAEGVLEEQIGRSIEKTPLGPQPEVAGKLSDGSDYKYQVVVSPVDDAGGLTAKEIKKVRVNAAWLDARGWHHKSVEACWARLPR